MVLTSKEAKAPVLVSVEVGTTWLFEEDGTFNVPIDGVYQIEMHGGGGGAIYYTIFSYSPYVGLYTLRDAVGGGGSGELYEVTLLAGNSYNIVIGAGGAAYAGETAVNGVVSGKTGGTTSFGDLLSLAGGGGGAVTVNSSATGTGTTTTRTPGSAKGSLATRGDNAGDMVATDTGAAPSASGGYGNSGNTSQTYGNGGGVVSGVGSAGQPGAVIITFLGVA